MANVSVPHGKHARVPWIRAGAEPTPTPPLDNDSKVLHLNQDACDESSGLNTPKRFRPVKVLFAQAG